jgi:hypothetical protein
MKLKPCPFCKKRKGDAVGTISGSYVHCDSCGAHGPWIPVNLKHTIRWNMRMAESAWNGINVKSLPRRRDA